MNIFQVIPNLDLGGAEKVVLELNKISGSSVLTFSNGLNLSDVKVIKKRNKWTHFFSVVGYLKRNRAHLVNGHMAPILPYLLLLNLLAPRIKLFYTIHYNFSKPKRIKDKLIHFFLFRVSTITIISVCAASDKLLRNYWKKVNSVIIYNGVTQIRRSENYETVLTEISKLRKNAQTKVFTIVARIVPVKNIQLLIDTFKKLELIEANVILIIIGYDPTNNQLELTKLKAQASSNVYFIGSKDNVADYLINTDCFCLSSISEGLPISLIEAFSGGVPAICTNVGGIGEVIKENKSGYLVDNGNLNEFYDKVKIFLNLSENEVEMMRGNAITTYNSKFTSEIMKDNYLRVYQNG